MKRFIALVATVALLGGVNVGLAGAARAGQLEVQGATLTWDDGTFYAPTGCSRFKFNWTNNSGRELLKLGFTLTDPFGDILAQDSKIGIQTGTSGLFDPQICKFELGNNLGPYVVTLIVEDFTSIGGGTWEASAQMNFIPRPGTQGASSKKPAKPGTVRCVSRQTSQVKDFKRKSCPRGWTKQA